MNLTFSDRLREERKRLGLNQPDFAAIAGVTKLTQINWEKGRRSPTASQLEQYHHAGVDVTYLITGSRHIESNSDKPAPAGQNLRLEKVIAAAREAEPDALTDLGLYLCGYGRCMKLAGGLTEAEFAACTDRIISLYKPEQQTTEGKA